MAAHGLNVPLASQTLWFVCSMGVGAVAALLYTLLRSFTRRLPRRSIGVAAGDAFFWLVIAALEFAVILSMPQNRFRWFHLLGQGIGAILFWLTMAPFVFRISSTLTKLFMRFAQWFKLCGHRFKVFFISLKRKKKSTIKADEKNS